MLRGVGLELPKITTLFQLHLHSRGKMGLLTNRVEKNEIKLGDNDAKFGNYAVEDTFTTWIMDIEEVIIVECGWNKRVNISKQDASSCHN